jgi:hypothetical protein
MIQNILWVLFAAFVSAVLYGNWDSALWEIRTVSSYGKYALGFGFLAFTAYGFYCSRRENLLKTVGKISQLHWGRQIGIDLYIGFFMFCGFIGLHQGGVAMLIWAVPVLIYGNQLTLLYLAVHYESILRKFTAFA